MVATTFGVGQIVWTLLWLFAFAIEIWLIVSILIDVFRSDDLSGPAKAGWVLLTILVPLIGILAYLIVRGDKLLVHRRQAAQEAKKEFDEDLRYLIGPPRSKAEEIASLAELRDSGAITAEEYEHLKAEVIGRQNEVAKRGDGAHAPAKAQN